MDKKQVQEIIVAAKDTITKAEKDLQTKLELVVKESDKKIIELALLELMVNINGEEFEIKKVENDKITVLPAWEEDEEEFYKFLAFEDMDMYTTKMLLDFIMLYGYKNQP